jgi:ribosomal protein S18 acetylase RimI-like enzyme
MSAPPFLTPTSGLSSDAIAEIRRRIGDHPIFRLYFETALEALARGEDNRRFLISEAGGLIQSIDFDTQSVTTAISPLTDAEVGLLIVTGHPVELHLDTALAKRVRRIATNRITADLALRFYILPPDHAVYPDTRCHRLWPSDLTEIRNFARRHNPATIFSDWMIDLPLLGVRLAGELEAIGGVIASHSGSGARMLGNFVTAPEARGQGYAKALCGTLAATSRAAGYDTIALCTTRDNVPACRAYEAVGFRCMETRTQIELAAPNP